MAVTELSNLINPEVMADMIDAKITNAIVVTPFATVDRKLVGQPGNTVTVPKYNYIGDASDVSEGNAVTPAQMTSSDVDYTVKKAMQAVELTDEAILSGLGNPVGQATSQLSKAIASKIDTDAISALLTSTNTYTDSGAISYAGIVNAIDVFNEEANTRKVIFVHPKQVTQLRKDTNFISADKYTGKVIMDGEIGMIANCSVVPSRRVTKTNGKFNCPIVKVETDQRTEDDMAALTIYLKRDTNVETERNTLSRKTDISVDKHYVAALTNEGKVVVAKFVDAAAAALSFASAAGSTSGKTALSGMDPTKTSAQSYVYQTGTDLALPELNAELNGSAWTSWDGSADITAATGLDLVLAIVTTSTNKCVAAGKQTVTAKA